MFCSVLLERGLPAEALLYSPQLFDCQTENVYGCKTLLKQVLLDMEDEHPSLQVS